MEKELERLSDIAWEIERLERQLKKKREARNRLALSIVSRGRYSLRKVAGHAGIKNPYLVELRKKQNA